LAVILQPGFGNEFLATGSILKHGKKIVVTRMELANDHDTLIAVAMGTYYAAYAG
jgi:acyl-coenzyme A thioesterase PaaI-like protein